MTSCEFDQLTITRKVWIFDPADNRVKHCAISKIVSEPGFGRDHASRGLELITDRGDCFVPPSAVFADRAEAQRDGDAKLALLLHAAQRELDRALAARNAAAAELENFRERSDPQ